MRSPGIILDGPCKKRQFASEQERYDALDAWVRP